MKAESQAASTRRPTAPILVTGAGGFIGERLCKRLQETGLEHYAVENRLHVDLRDARLTAELVATRRPATVIHLAASPDARGDHFDAENTTRCAESLAAAIAQLSHCTLVNVGSYKQYGNGRLPFHESGAPQPTSAYGQAKQFAEDIFYRGQATDQRRVLLRMSPVFGENEGPKRFISRTTSEILRGQRLMSVAADVVWQPLYVDDCVEAILRSCTLTQSAILNVGGVARSLRQTVLDIAEIMGCEAKSLSFQDTPISGHACADLALGGRLLGDYSSTPWSEALRRVVMTITQSDSLNGNPRR